MDRTQTTRLRRVLEWAREPTLQELFWTAAAFGCQVGKVSNVITEAGINARRLPGRVGLLETSRRFQEDKREEVD